MLNQLLRTVKLGIKSLLLHTGRSVLTILGIVFGVSSVIAMLAVGEGASLEQQEAIYRLGSGNILIKSVKPPADEQQSNRGSRRHGPLQYGLTYLDALRIHKTVPGVNRIVPVRRFRDDAQFDRTKRQVKVTATTASYRSARGLDILTGRFICANDNMRMDNICVVSESLAKQLFGFRDPLGSVLRLGNFCFKVVGVVESELNEDARSEAEKYDLNLFIPLATAKALKGDTIVQRSTGSFSAEKVELHDLIVQCDGTDRVEQTANAVQQVLEHYHEKVDYEMNVPLRQLREMRRTKRMFTIVLGCIAAISLLVGGIGIMNIMLATVTERTREIGVRRALGARKRDIITQFLVETIVLSVLGGIIGVIIGVIIPMQISRLTNVNTVITLWSLAVAFGVSAFTGVIFGLYPAIRAANLDPIEALRHE